MRKKSKPQRRTKRYRNQDGGGLGRALAAVGKVVAKTLKVATTTPKLLGTAAGVVGKTISAANRALHRAVPFPTNPRLRYLVKQHIPHPVLLPLPFVNPIVTASNLMQKPKAVFV